MEKVLRPTVDPYFTEVSENLSKDDLKVAVIKLRVENHYLRRGARVKPHVRLVLRAEASAKLMALWHAAGYQVGRKACRKHGLTEDAWYAGRALLMAGRLWLNDRFTTEDVDVIKTRIQTTKERALVDPSVIGYRIPLSRRPKYFVK